MTKRSPSLADVFEYGLHLPSRTVYLCGEIEEAGAARAARGLAVLDDGSGKAITLSITTPGGCVYSAMALYDAIQATHCPVRTLATGLCMSAGALIVCGGSPGFRVATPNAALMVHGISGDYAFDRARSIRAEAAHAEALQERMADILARHSSRKLAWWKKRLNQASDLYLDAENAVRHGLVDAILFPKN